MRLLLMRHGQTHANVSGELDTAHPGLDLTDLGRAKSIVVDKENTTIVGEPGCSVVQYPDGLPDATAMNCFPFAW